MTLCLILTSLMAAAEAGFKPDDTIRYQIQEDAAIGFKLGNVITDSGIKKKHLKHEIQQLEFRFLAEPPIPLTIGTTDGILKTKGIIDRESIPFCRQRDLCDVNIDVTVQPVDFFRIIKACIPLYLKCIVYIAYHIIAKHLWYLFIERQ